MIIDFITENDNEVRRSYWLLRAIAKNVPITLLRGSKNEFLDMRISDAVQSLAETIARNWEERTKELRAREKMPTYGDHMTMADWTLCVERAGFIDYDGHGNLATATELSNITIHPSDVTVLKLKMPAWATHVMWFNK